MGFDDGERGRHRERSAIQRFRVGRRPRMCVAGTAAILVTVAAVEVWIATLRSR